MIYGNELEILAAYVGGALEPLAGQDENDQREYMSGYKMALIRVQNYIAFINEEKAKFQEEMAAELAKGNF